MSKCKYNQGDDVEYMGKQYKIIGINKWKNEVILTLYPGRINVIQKEVKKKIK